MPLASMSLETLISACMEGGTPAWEEFVQHFHTLIASVVLRTARRCGSNSPALFDDLIQETYLKIYADRHRILGEFSPAHPDAFYGYVKVIAANVVYDHFRSKYAQKRGQRQPETSIDDVSAPVSSENQTEAMGIHKEILLVEIDRALCATLSEADRKRDRAIFWLYYRYGLTATAIADLPSVGLTVKGVESVIHRLTTLVRNRLMRQHSLD